MVFFFLRRCRRLENRKSLTIRMDEELHKQVKIKAVMDGTTIQDYILRLIRADLAKVEK